MGVASCWERSEEENSNTPSKSIVNSIRSHSHPRIVIPAKAGIQEGQAYNIVPNGKESRIPACAGMTGLSR